MALTVETLRAACAAARQAMGPLEQELNEADAKLGDGDTGGMLKRVVDKLAEADLSAMDDVGASFAALARAAVSATGSSLGTLLATALMTMAKATKGREEVPWSELGGLLGDARDAMLARGGAKLGDKTVIDALDALATAIAGQSEVAALGSASRKAVDAALLEFRDRPCLMGRARMFGDKSRGIDDPGMLAFARLTNALAG